MFLVHVLGNNLHLHVVQRQNSGMTMIVHANNLAMHAIEFRLVGMNRREIYLSDLTLCRRMIA